MRARFSALGLILLCGLSCGCGLFSRKPPLPQPATTTGERTNADEFATAVQNAGLVYFPIDESGVAAEQAAWKMLEAFRRSGVSFAIAWQGVDIDQQPVFDDLAAQHNRLEDALGVIRWGYRKSARERSKAILRATAAVPQLALGCPQGIQEKLRSGGKLSETERALVPQGYRIPEGGLENFAEQLAAVHGLREREIANFYQAHLFAEQFAAERIVAFFHARPASKLLVFSRKRDLAGEGVPYFVSQKLKVPQINFDLDRHARDRKPRLLTGPAAGGRFFGWL